MKILQNLRICYLLTMIFVVFSTNLPLKAQDPNSPISTYISFEKYEYGVYLAFGQAFTNGFLETECPECIFESAVGTDIRIGSLFNYFVYSDVLAVKAGLGFHNYSLNSGFFDRETIELNNFPNEFIDVNFYNSANLNISNINTEIALLFVPFKRVFAESGFSIDIPIASKLLHYKELKQKTAILSNGEIIRLAIDPENGSVLEGSTSQKAILQDSKYANLSTPIYFTFGMGANLFISEKYHINPNFKFFLPITNFSSTNQKNNIFYWNIGIQVKKIRVNSTMNSMRVGE